MPKPLIQLASANAHKLREFRELFPGWDIEPGTCRLHREDGADFVTNALIKARAYWQGPPVLADDSGLCVRALGGAPGVHSARFGEAEAGRSLTDAEKNRLLLQKMHGIEDRTAYYVCSLVLLWEPERFVVVQETWSGRILSAERGQGGFGYDPIFLPDGLDRSSAELSPDEKNALSHRGRAAHRLKLFLQKETP